MKKIILLILIAHQSYALEFISNDIGASIPIHGYTQVADFNNDGFDDIFTSGLRIYSGCGNTSPSPVNCFESSAKILLNNKKGGFIETELHSSLPIYVGLSVIGDLDSDGDIDILSWYGDAYLNDGLGNFIGAVNVGFQGNYFRSRSIYLADIDNDSVLEIFSGGIIYKRVSTQPLNYQPIEVGFTWGIDQYLRIADFNNDGFTDLLKFGDDRNITITMNDKIGLFPASNKITLNEKELLKLAIGDVDNDQDIDIVLSGMRILKNNLAEGFKLSEIVNNFSNPSSIYDYIPHELKDFNDDGYLDILLTLETFTNSSRYNRFSTFPLLNNGEGEFAFDTHRTENLGMISGHFNQDNKVDVVSFKRDIYEQAENQLLNDYIFNKLNVHDFHVYFMKTGGFIEISELSTLPHSRSYLFDFEKDGPKGIIFTSNFDPHLYYERQQKSFYLSEVNTVDFSINKFDFIALENFYDALIVAPIDYNNDGLDDLITLVNGSKLQIMLNSESGFSNENVIDLTDLFIDEIFYGVEDLPLFADINGDGHKDMIHGLKRTGESYAIMIYLNNSANEFQLHEFEVDNPATYRDELLLSLGDINNDGFSDLGYYNTDFEFYIVYGSQDIEQMSVELAFSESVAGIYFYDYNLDGFKDLYVVKRDDKVIYRSSNQQGVFQEPVAILSGLEEYIGKIAVADLNGDGHEELITEKKIYNSSHLKIFEKDQSGEYVSILKETFARQRNNILLSDFDGDSLIDIAIGGKIIFSRNLSFQSGLHYDSSHSGHGFSIEDVGNEQFFTVFYTYGNDGYPEWYTDLGLFEKPREDYWNVESVGNGLIRSEYDNTNQTISQNAEDNYIGLIEHEKCSDIYGEINLHYEIGIDRFGQPVSKDDWCSKPIVGYYQRPSENNLSGLWWAGSGDSGWGWSVSLVEREETTDIVVVLYYYDGEGNPRWLIGQQSGFEAGVEITLEMNWVKGYPRWATPQPLELEPAGTMSLTLNQASRDLTQGGSLSIDVTYPGPEGGNWVRNNIPIALFSEPRN